MFANGAGVLWEQDAGPIWQICLDCEQGDAQVALLQDPNAYPMSSE